MIEVLYFAAGAAVGAAALALRLRHRRVPIATTAAPPAAEPLPPAAPAPDPRELATPPIPLDSRNLALSLADELANLTSGVEVGAHGLIEAASERAQIARAAEALDGAVQRLRRLHGKLLAFGRTGLVASGTTAIPALVQRLAAELQRCQLGIELRWDPPQHLPDAAIAPAIAYDALLFLCSAMLRAERGATLLAVASEPCFTGPHPRLRLELVLEWTTAADAQPATPQEPRFLLDLEASRQLLASNSCELALHHEPGRLVRAIVHLPLAPADAVAEPLASPPVRARPATPHRYGGALVLEADPSVRAILAAELKASGRAVFACADGSSARTFLEATPDRFELLIVDHPQRLAGDDALATTIRTIAPALKIVVLAPAEAATAEHWPGVRHIQKPFGVHELRHALASLLVAG